MHVAPSMGPTALLERLVSINSVYPHEAEIAHYAESLLKGMGFSAKRVFIEGTDRFGIIADRGSPRICFFGHLDTVEPSRGWATDPFKLEGRDGRLYGLGAYDMKGGIAAMLSAAARTRNPLRIVLSVDEENISEGAHALVKAGAFDGIEGVVSAEAGNSESFSGGTGAITVSRRGRAVFECKMYGESAHGALGHGVSAIGRAMGAYAKLEEMNWGFSGYVRPSAYIRSIHSEARSLSIPEEAVMEVDRHYIVGETLDSVERGLSGIFDDVHLKSRRTPYLEPFNFEGHPFIGRIVSMVTKATARPPMINHALSVGDENIIAKHSPVAIIGPDGGNEHSANEFVLEKSLIGVCALYEAIMRNS